MIDLEARLDLLFAGPLAEFVSSRDRLVKELREAGASEEAHWVRAKTKPSVPAWAVNQLHYHEAEALAALIGAGERLRLAQQSGDSTVLKSAGRERRELLRGLVQQAAAILAGGGHAATPATLLRVERTLETLAVYGRSGRVDPPAGRLVRELEPPGFDVLATLPGLPAPAAPPLVPAQREAQVPKAQIRARQRLAQLEAALARRGAERLEAQAELERSKAAEREREGAVEQASAAHGRALGEHGRAVARLEQARQRCDLAEAAYLESRSQLEQARSELSETDREDESLSGT